MQLITRGAAIAVSSRFSYSIDARENMSTSQPQQYSSSSCSKRLTFEDVEAVLVKQGRFQGPPEVLRFELTPFSSEPLGYLGVHELLRVEARERNSAAAAAKVQTLTYFVKSRGPSAIDFDLLIFREEAKFFSEVVPQLLISESLEISKPEAWAAECYLVTEDLMVLEDLRAAGLRAPGRSLRPRELNSALTCLGRLHASVIAWESREERSVEAAWPGFFREKVFVPDDGGSAWKWLAAGIELVEALARDKLALDAKLVKPAYELAIKRYGPDGGGGGNGNSRNVLCHDDLWFNNFMFDDKGEKCRLVDFQMISYTCYAVDLAQIIYLNTRVEERKKSEQKLLELYHSALLDALKSYGYTGAEITFDELLRNYDERRICGLVAAVQFLPIALWSKDAAEKYSNPETCLYYMYTSRKDIVLEVMTSDEIYRDRIEETVKDLIEYMENFKS